MWEPLYETELYEWIAAAEDAMEPPVKAFWERIKIKPEKWQQSPWGDEGGGFWVVALMGQECIYYNDIEEGFNVSEFETIGQIKNYYCDQDELHHCIGSYYTAFMEAVASATS